MPLIVVANPKGGVGKSTIATNIAGYLARQGATVMLGDIDVQQSARAWLALRPASLPVIHTWDMAADNVARPPKGVSHAVIDTPAGVSMKTAVDLARQADRVIVPVQPSPFDIAATAAFLQALNQAAPAAIRQGKVALVGVRVAERFRSADHLKAFCDTAPAPTIALLRETQNYLHLAAHGLTLWDVAASKVEKDLAQWQPICDWLE